MIKGLLFEYTFLKQPICQERYLQFVGQLFIMNKVEKKALKRHKDLNKIAKDQDKARLKNKPVLISTKETFHCYIGTLQVPTNHAN